MRSLLPAGASGASRSRASVAFASTSASDTVSKSWYQEFQPTSARVRSGRPSSKVGRERPYAVRTVSAEPASSRNVSPSTTPPAATETLSPAIPLTARIANVGLDGSSRVSWTQGFHRAVVVAPTRSVGPPPPTAVQNHESCFPSENRLLSRLCRARSTSSSVGVGGIAITPLADQDWKPSTTMPRSPRT